MVREKSTHLEVIEKVMAFAAGIGFEILNLEFSPIKGPEGNIEYLLYLQNHGDESAVREAGLTDDVAEDIHMAQAADGNMNAGQQTEVKACTAPGADAKAVVEAAHQTLQA